MAVSIGLFGQTGRPKVTREIFFFCQEYRGRRLPDGRGQQGPHAEIENEALLGGNHRHQVPHSIRMLKYAFNLVDDGLMASRYLLVKLPVGLHD